LGRERCGAFGGKRIREPTVRNTSGLKRGGSPGRPKGLPNKATVEVKQFSTELVVNPEYRAMLQERLLAGTLPPILEAMLWHYAFGTPYRPRAA
jgi:hypothetical protein